MSLILLCLYPLAIQYQRGGWFKLLLPITLFALVIDVIANYTELALLTWDFPKEKEYTFSERLVRLQYDTSWSGKIAKPIVKYCNYFSPNGNHIRT